MAQEQMEASKAEIRALKMKLLSFQYNEQENKSRTKSQCLDYLKINQELALDNGRLQKQLKHKSLQIKSVEETYLSELQRQESALQTAKRDNEVLKEKCKQQQSQMGYFKDILSQKENTLLELYKSRDVSKQQSAWREISSGQPEELLGADRRFSK